jgi:thiosulfate/3-mercaptopyruvate sulfurtransferase
MSAATFRDPDAIVSTDWLNTHLEDPDLRIFDCSTQLVFEEGTGRPYRVVNGIEDHANGHIPGAGCFDLQGDFSDQDSPFAMTLAAPERVAAAFERSGIGDSTRVVLYSRRSPSWATRFWWMLKWLGFDNAAILDGCYETWQREGRPISTGLCRYPTESLTICLRPSMFVDKDSVRQAIDDPETCTVNALGPDLFSGQNTRYGRPGRIPNSVNVPKTSLVDPDTLKLLPASDISARFRSAKADKARQYDLPPETSLVLM